MNEHPPLHLSPSFFTHRLWRERRKYSRVEAWIDCLRSATLADTLVEIGGRSIPVPAGGFVASERGLSERWKWSRTQVRSFLNSLEKNHEINRVTTHGVPLLVLVFVDVSPAERPTL